MREFTKSTMSTGLAMSLFGIQQLMSLVRSARPGTARRTSNSFDAVAQSMVDQCGDSLRETFHTTDKIQRGLVDLTFRMLSLNAARSPNGTSSTVGPMQQATDAFRRWTGGLPGSGCGCGCGASEDSAAQPEGSWGAAGFRSTSGDSATGWGPAPPMP
jgi:hypothetical protein